MCCAYDSIASQISHKLLRSLSLFAETGYSGSPIEGGGSGLKDTQGVASFSQVSRLHPTKRSMKSNSPRGGVLAQETTLMFHTVWPCHQSCDSWKSLQTRNFVWLVFHHLSCGYMIDFYISSLPATTYHLESLESSRNSERAMRMMVARYSQLN